MSLLDLPTEILEIIIDEHVEDLETIKALMLVNKRLHDLAAPYIFCMLEIYHPKKLEYAINILKEKPEYCQLIEYFSLGSIFNSDKLEIDPAYTEYLNTLINTKMTNLTSLFLRSSFSFSFNLGENFNLNNQLAELEISYDAFEKLFGHHISFPNLKFLRISRSESRDTVDLLHYLGYPFVEIEKMRKLLNSKQKYEFKKLLDFEEPFDILLPKNGETPEILFPSLVSLAFGYMTISSTFIYLLGNALVGLTSLEELDVRDTTCGYSDEYIDQITKKRTGEFHFVAIFC